MEFPLRCIVETMENPPAFSPFIETLTFELLPIAGKPLLDLFLSSLEAAGFEEIMILVDPTDPSFSSFIKERESEAIIELVDPDSNQNSHESVFRFYGQQYLEPRNVIRFVRFVEEHKDDLCVIPVPEQELLELAAGQPSKPVSMAYFPAGIPPVLPTDLSTPEFRFFCPPSTPGISLKWPWDLLRLHSMLIDEIVPAMKGIIQQGATIIDPVLIETGATIRAGAYVEGPVVIGQDCVVGPNCFLRPGTCLGKSVRVGNAVEIKNTIVMDNTNIGHLAYIGDSIIGPNCNFGAGTKIANLRLDNGNFQQKIGEEVIDTGLRKLGVFVGENVKTGINCSLMGGTSIGAGAEIGPGAVIYRNIDAHTRVLLRQQTDIANK
jgi:NDP-sugar pyrophosphorylase family protein